MKRFAVILTAVSMITSSTFTLGQDPRPAQASQQALAPMVKGPLPMHVPGGPPMVGAQRMILPMQPSMNSNPAEQLKIGLGEAAPNENFVTKRVDFKETIAKLADAKNLSATDARLEALMLLRLNPCRRELRTENSGATFELVDVDHFEITAEESYFAQLPHMMTCMELGMKQVAIQCRMIQLDSRKSKRLNSFLEVAEINCGTIPSVIPVATAETDSEVSPASFVTTSTVVRESTPATSGRITKVGLEKMTSYLKQTKASYQFSPTVVTYPGQTGTISDVSNRPFVVGLEKVRGGKDLVAYQPLVQTIGDGTTINVRGIPRGGSIQLMGDVSMSEIVDLNQFKFATSGEAGQQSIQIPKQVLRQIHFSATLEPDVAYYIDPNFETNYDVNAKPGATKAGNTRTVFLFQATLIDMQPNTRVAEKK